MKNTSKEAYYERLKQLADVNKTSIKETQNRTSGTLIDYKRAADGVAYGIIKENHNYYLKKGGTKKDPDVSDFAYIGGLGNITNFQYKSLGDADKNRNMILHTIGEASVAKVNPNGSKKMLMEDRAGREIDQAAGKLGDLDAATAAEQQPEDNGEAEMQAGLGAEPAGETPAEEPAPVGDEMPAPAPEGGEEGGMPPPEGGAPEGGEELPEPELGGEEGGGEELPEPELGGEEGGEEAPEGEEGAPDDAEMAVDAEGQPIEEPIKDLEKGIGKITNKIRKTDLEPSITKSFLKSFIQAFRDKLPELEIEDRKDIANLLLKIVPPEDVAGLGDSMPPEEQGEEGLEEQGCSECGTFARYAESMGYGSADALMECGEEGVANLVSNYANHSAEGMNDGDADGVALVIKLVNPEILNKLKTDYGHDDYANQLQPMVNSMQEATEEECYSKVQEMFGGQTDPANVQAQPIVEEEDEEPESEEGEGLAGVIDDEPEGEEEITVDEPEEIKFGGAQSLGGGVMKPDGAPTTISVTSANGTAVEVSLNEVMKKLKQVVAEGKLKAEGNAFTAKLAKTPKGGEFKLGDKVKKDTSNYDKKTIEESKPSAGLSKEKKSEVVKKAKAGEDIGKKGKGFEKVAAKAAKEYGSAEKGKKVAAAAMWKNIKKEGVEEEKEVMTESERKIRAYVRKRLEEQSGLRKPSLNESKKSETLKRLDEMIDKQFSQYESVIKKKSKVNELFGFGGNKETPEQTELVNKIKEMTQTMVDSNPEEVVFAGGSPEKQIQLLTKLAQDNKFRGEVRFMQSPRDERWYLQYIPKNSAFQDAASGAASGSR